MAAPIIGVIEIQKEINGAKTTAGFIKLPENVQEFLENETEEEERQEIQEEERQEAEEASGQEHLTGQEQKQEVKQNVKGATQKMQTQTERKKNEKKPRPKMEGREDKKSYQCTEENGQCKLKFEWKTSLNNHIRFKHKNRKLFSCQECGKEFGQKNELMSHHIRCSRVESLDRKKKHDIEKSYPCNWPGCEKKFHHESSVYTHIKIKHKNQLRHECTACKKKFGQASELKSHMNIDHVCVKGCVTGTIYKDREEKWNSHKQHGHRK